MFKRGKGAFVSILLPTRNRIKDLKETIMFFDCLAKNKKEVEYCIKTDDDDDESINFISKLKKEYNIKHICTPRLNGYLDVFNFLNMCCSISTGDWLWLFNDDARIVTKNWDVILQNINPWDICGWKGNEDICLYSPQVKNVSVSWQFPILRRKVYEILGHFSQGVYSDEYIYSVMSEVDSCIHVPSICVEEISYLMNDKTKIEGREADVQNLMKRIHEAEGKKQKDIAILKKILLYSEESK